ncbi:MAG TPA: Rrf2 family transcriptional regulator [Acidobacteriota bacterium]|nr:Rrf2 family transcriptional regulator [Acidobacteriota bacterium]
MKVTAKSDYAILALFHLATDKANRPIQSRTIAAGQQIPHRFLEQILLNLKKAGLVRSVRGAKGGYQLALPPSEISLKNAIEAVEGGIHLIGNRENRAATVETDRKLLQSVWEEVEQSFIEKLSSVTLEEIVTRQQQQRDVLMYHI